MHIIHETLKNPKWIKFSFNPWKAHAPDCAIRATAAATGLDYREICKRLGVSWKRGKGLIRDSGIALTNVEHVFDEYFDIIEDYYDNYEFVPDEYKNTLYAKQLDNFDKSIGVNAVSKTTLNEFIDEFKNQGIFLVSLEGNPDAQHPAARSGGHLTCVKCLRGQQKQGFIDTWDCGEMYVDAYMRVKKQEPADSPKHWKYDYAQHKFII